MSLIYLIRHGMTDAVGHRLVGRSPGVHLNNVGIEQIRSLARFLNTVSIQHILSSPLDRARETAGILAEQWHAKVETCDGLTEIDYGSWTGAEISTLIDVPAWKYWNQFRSGARVPGGESMIEVQARMLNCVQSLETSSGNDANAGDHSYGSAVAWVSHGDPIKSLLIYWLGMDLDAMMKLEVSPGSVSVVELNPWGVKVLVINLGPREVWPFV